MNRQIRLLLLVLWLIGAVALAAINAYTQGRESDLIQSYFPLTMEQTSLRDYVGLIQLRDLERSDLYMARADGSDWRQLTNTPEEEFLVSWSPDNQHIAFAIIINDTRRVLIMNADGSELRFLLPVPEPGLIEKIAWSPQGRQMVLTFRLLESNGWVAWLVNADGTYEVLSEGDSFALHGWSPDGHYLHYTVEYEEYSELWVYAPESGERVRVAQSRSWGVLWHPDNKRLLYYTREGMGDFTTFIVNADGSEAREIAVGPYAPHAWLSGGARILLTEFDHGWGYLYEVATEGGEVISLAPEPVSIGGVSPTGDAVLYSYIEDERVWLHRVGDETVQLVNPHCGDALCTVQRESPSWTPDDTMLLYGYWREAPRVARTSVRLQSLSALDLPSQAIDVVPEEALSWRVEAAFLPFSSSLVAANRTVSYPVEYPGAIEEILVGDVRTLQLNPLPGPTALRRSALEWRYLP